MLSHKRPGMTRGKLVVIVAVSIAVLFAAVLVFESVSFFKLSKDGALDSLGTMGFASRFSTSKNAAPAPAETSYDVITDDDPYLGDPNAPIQAVEFIDFGCPYCKDESSIIRELLTRHPDKIFLQIRDFPIDELHPNATAASVAAACAGYQGKYWAMHDILFANQENLTDADLARYALSVGVDEKEYAACLKEGAAAQDVAQDVAAATAAGVVGTPTFIVNGVKIEGGILASDWEKIVSYFSQQ